MGQIWLKARWKMWLKCDIKLIYNVPFCIDCFVYYKFLPVPARIMSPICHIYSEYNRTILASMPQLYLNSDLNMLMLITNSCCLVYHNNVIPIFLATYCISSQQHHWHSEQSSWTEGFRLKKVWLKLELFLSDPSGTDLSLVFFSFFFFSFSFSGKRLLF